MRMVGAASPVAPVLQSSATNEGEDDDEKLLQTKAESSSPSAQSSLGSSSARSSVHAALSVPGQPLAAETRAFFEPRFGRDLSGVRLHTGAAAERSAREISASAYTVGRDIVFGNGGLAPETPAGRWLMAHELAHVLQQGAGEATVVRRFFIYAGGYPSPDKDEAEETASIKAKTWMPWSRDFGYTAHTAGGGLGVKTIDELFGAIQGQGIHSITELGLIGHGAGGAIGFSGTVAFKPDATVTFADDGLITTKSLLAESTARLYYLARDRFATGAVITLYACRSGTDPTFVENLSQAFGGVCVRAFKTGIDWCITSNPDGTIASRGWIRIGDSAACQEDIRSLTPDVASTSCGARRREAPRPKRLRKGGRPRGHRGSGKGSASLVCRVSTRILIARPLSANPSRIGTKPLLISKRYGPAIVAEIGRRVDSRLKPYWELNTNGGQPCRT